MSSNYAYAGHRKQGPHAPGGTMTDVLDRIRIARTGTEAQRQALINDEDPYVREAVAQYGTEEQRQTLINDEDGRVRVAANNG